MAAKKSASRSKKAYAAQFCVVPERTLAAFNQRTADQVVEAQAEADDAMFSALESMVKSARASRLEGRAALQVAAVAW